MAALSSTATERIHLRTTYEAKQVIEQAAQLTGTTMSAFMIQNAYERALDLIEQNQRITLNAQQWQALQTLVQQQPPANPELQALLKLGETLV